MADENYLPRMRHRIAALEAEKDSLRTQVRQAVARGLGLHLENQRLREDIAWIWDHSNDPGVVERARKALNPQEAANG